MLHPLADRNKSKVRGVRSEELEVQSYIYTYKNVLQFNCPVFLENRFKGTFKLNSG